MNAFDHLVRFDETTRELFVYRIDAHGGKSLLTKSPLPKGSGWGADLHEFAKLLSENLLMDSPAARRLLEL
jgi:hypothetical protein